MTSPKHPSSPWTDERVAQLEKLVSEGFSYAQIAEKLGGVTRNTVCGKANRMGFAGFERPSHPSRPKALAGQPKDGRSQVGMNRSRGKGDKPFVSVLDRPVKAPPVARAQYQNAGLNMRTRKFTAPKVETSGAARSITAKQQMAGANNGPKAPTFFAAVIIESPNKVSLDDLKRWHCRAIDDETGLFCGNGTEDGSSWCKGHRAIFCIPTTTTPQKRADRLTVRLANHF